MRHGRHGFTMIELMIVMVVIGVLAAMMMFSSTEAESSARAQSIVNNFMQIQKAVSSWYADNLHRIVIKSGNQYNILDTDGKTKLALKVFAQKYGAEITKYLHNGTNIKLTGKEDKSIKAGDYVLIDVDYKKWYVCYNTGKDTHIQGKLAGRAKTLGLIAVNDNLNGVGSVYSGGKFVGISVLDLDK